MSYSHGYSDYENSKAENAALFTRIECMASKIRELETNLNSTKNELLTHQEQNDKYHENDARLSTLVDLSRQQLTEKTHAIDDFRQEIAKLRAERDQCKEQAQNAYQSISTYTSENQNLKSAKDSLERQFYHADNSVRTFLMRMQDLVGEGDLSFEKICEIFETNKRTNQSVNEKFESLQEAVESFELEGRAARETIKRLASEVTNEQQMTMKNINLLNEKKSEVNRLQAECTALSGQINDISGHLEASKNDKYNLSRILTEKSNELDATNSNLYQLNQSLDYITQNFDNFRRQVIESLQNSANRDNVYSGYHGNSHEDTDILQNLRAQLDKVDILENQIQMMRKDSDFRNIQANECLQQLEHNKRTEAQMAADIRQLRDSLASTEIITEGLRDGKQNHMRFIEELVHNLKLPSSIEGLSTESAALTRAQQLVSLETEALASRSSQLHMQQRKMKGMKEQIENKDLHNTMLRKKIVQLEEEIGSKSQLQQSKDDQIYRGQKMYKMNDKLTQELVSAKNEIQQLKVELCDYTKREKSILKEDSATIHNLEDTIQSMEEKVQKQNFKIDKLRELKKRGEKILDETNPRLENMENQIDGLSLSLNQCQEREKQLLDLREAVARMLSLDISSLAVPDYEIISRLDALVHSSCVTADNYVHSPEEDRYVKPLRDTRPIELIDKTQKRRSVSKSNTIHNRRLNMKVDAVKY